MSYFSQYFLSAAQHPDVVDRYLAKELLAQRVAGPFSYLPLPNFRVSPIGVVPKKTLIGLHGGYTIPFQ